MHPTRLTRGALGLFLLLTGASVSAADDRPSARERPQPFTAAQFENLHRLIRPQPGELRFHQIPWLIDIWEAREKAAAAGKPILVWSGAGGAPVGVC